MSNTMSRLMPAPSDGRMFTSYLSAGQREDGLQRKYKVVNENQYRKFLQHNSARVAADLRTLHLIVGIPALPRRVYK